MLKAFKKTLDEGVYSFIIGMVYLGHKFQTISIQGFIFCLYLNILLSDVNPLALRVVFSFSP